MIFVHDPGDVRFRDPEGAVVTGSRVTLRVRVTPDGGTAPVLTVTRLFRTEKQDFKISHAGCSDGLFEFVLEPSFLSRPGVYRYGFGCGGEYSGEAGRITVYVPGNEAPAWFKKAFIYQIFPDRFAVGKSGKAAPKEGSFIYDSFSALPEYIKDEKGEVIRWDFFGGTLEGIADNLGYIRSLGADTVYLNPVFSSVSNHRYDTADYGHVDDMLGGDEAFYDLVNRMNGEGMRLILDGVFSHTGKESLYFKKALRGEKPWADWYRFREDGTYDCWWGVEDLPCVNELQPDYLEYTVTGENSIVKRWLRAGASGWRLDVADELPDEYLEKLFEAAVSEKPDAVVFGEVWEDGTDKISYGVHRSYYTSGELHSQTNYPFRNNLIAFFEGSSSAREITAAFSGDRMNYPPDVYRSLINMTGSHDVPRLFSVLLGIVRGDRRLAKDLLRTYMMIQFTFPGVPLVYYGDEICAEGGADPDNRRFFDMEATESSEGSAMRGWLAGMARLRREAPEILEGEIRFINAGDNIFAYERSFGGSRIVLVADRFGRGFGSGEDAAEGRRALESACSAGYNIIAAAGGYGLLVRTA